MTHTGIISQQTLITAVFEATDRATDSLTHSFPTSTGTVPSTPWRTGRRCRPGRVSWFRGRDGARRVRGDSQHIDDLPVTVRQPDEESGTVVGAREGHFILK